ncbi:guanine nucleotide binding protein, alpha subunit [Ephemerocybe angulata]|uniref:Guanine nucleotide binding protein, alpha subunit n=1 Tax=Ephemerocybe angulata TaxID=980116 RepID=A0A8H6I2D2_9AGAR|nr:guanine nucleotide binding protein, alpha subunit [Tulosesus angulatus]
MPVPAGRRDSDDPLDEVLRPPPDETTDQRQIRLDREAEAKRISLAIDASIKAERQARRKKRIVRLLLLGQSESGKSTTLRQFQRLYTPTAFREERILWRAVIQLNIVRSIRIIIEALESPVSPTNSPFSSPRSRARSISRPPPLPSTSQQPPPLPHSEYYYANGSGSGSHSPGEVGRSLPADNSDGDIQFGSPPRGQHRYHQQSPPRARHRQGSNYQNSHASGSRHPGHYRAPSNPDSEVDSDSDFQYHHGSPRSLHNSSSTLLMLNAHLETLKQKLQPLKHIEQMLIAKLVPPNEEEATHLAAPGNPYISSAQVAAGPQTYRSQEIFIRPGPGWKGALSRARVNYPGFGGSEGSGGPNGQRPMSAGNTGLETQDEPQEVLHMLKKEIVQLWQDPVVKEILKRKKIKLEQESGFFLDDLDRVTALKYMPSDDDVLKARLKTVGVSEYKFEMEVSAGRDSGTEWRIVDVGGSRTTWAPFFDDVDAIIFLAPISAFDQVLTEDKTVNRLEDSVLLWKAVCSNKLLANVDLVLFLNKCDILEKKLNDGVRLTKYVRTYGDRENTLDGVSKYLRGKFAAIHREYSPNPRKFYVFCTSVTDAATTAGIIASVRDMVIRQHLKQSKLL